MHRKASSSELFNISEQTSICYQRERNIAALLAEKRELHLAAQAAKPVVPKPLNCIKPKEKGSILKIKQEKERVTIKKEEPKPVFFLGLFSVLGSLLSLVAKDVDHIPTLEKASKKSKENILRLIM